MNISSAIVISNYKNDLELISKLNSIKGCEVHMHKENKIVVSIEAENISAETGVMKKIENTPGVLSAKLVFAYSENELDQEMRKVEESPDYPEWLNKDTNAKDIPYSGKLKM